MEFWRKIRDKLLQEVLVSAKELELFEKREDMEEILKGKRMAKTEVWRVSDVAGVGVNWKAASGAKL